MMPPFLAVMLLHSTHWRCCQRAFCLTAIHLSPKLSDFTIEVFKIVIPAQLGIQGSPKNLDSGRLPGVTIERQILRFARTSAEF